MTFQMPVMEPCHFCELARSRDAWNLIIEDPLTMTVLNGRQYEAGQSIVFPKRHAPTLLDLSAHEAAAVMLAAKRIGAAITSALAPEAIAPLPEQWRPGRPGGPAFPPARCAANAGQ